MRHILKVFVVLVVFLQGSYAGEFQVVLDGEVFTKKFTGKPPNGDRLIEFVRENETFESWTKLVGFRYQQLPGIANDPKKAAVAMAQVVKMTNPKSQSRVIVSNERSEAIIDFLTWPPDGKYMEFNVFRYAKSADGNAVVSLQFAYRFTDTSHESLEQFKKIRGSWINQSVAFDIKGVDTLVSE